LYSTTGSGVNCFFDENENVLRGIEDVAASVIEKEKKEKSSRRQWRAQTSLVIR
jgi:hypothetical protein